MRQRFALGCLLAALLVPSLPVAAQSSDPPLLPGEVVFKLQDGCRMVGNPGNHEEATRKMLAGFVWTGPCVHGLASGRGELGGQDSLRTRPESLRQFHEYVHGRSLGMTDLVFDRYLHPGPENIPARCYSDQSPAGCIFTVVLIVARVADPFEPKWGDSLRDYYTQITDLNRDRYTTAL